MVQRIINGNGDNSRPSPVVTRAVITWSTVTFAKTCCMSPLGSRSSYDRNSLCGSMMHNVIETENHKVVLEKEYLN